MLCTIRGNAEHTYLVDKFEKNLYNKIMDVEKKTKYYATLCNNHNQIIHNLKEIKKLTKDERIRELINDTLDFSRYCKKQGQHCENRLRAYYDSIIDLGFERVRKEKKEWDK